MNKTERDRLFRLLDGFFEPLRESLADGLNDLYNSHTDQTEVNAHQKSPEYIKKILRGYSHKNE
jgi:hypothetical protein